MKTKIENSSLWVDHKLESTLDKALNHYDKKELFSVLSASQVDKINKILELEKSFEKELGAYGASGYLCIPRIVEKEPTGDSLPIDKIVKFFIEDLYPVIKDLQKELTKDKRDIPIKAMQNGKTDLQNVFWNINYCLNKFKKQKKFLNDIYNKTIKLEKHQGNYEIEDYVKGMKAYVCGNGVSFIEGKLQYGNYKWGNLANAKIYESLELAQSQHSGFDVYEVEIKLVSPSLVKQSSVDEVIKASIAKNQIEASLPYKEEVKTKPPKI